MQFMLHGGANLDNNSNVASTIISNLQQDNLEDNLNAFSTTWATQQN